MDQFSDDEDFMTADKQLRRVFNCAELFGSEQQDPKVQTSFSISSIVRVLSTISEYKKSIIQTMGLEGLLHLKPQKKLPRLLVLWMIRHMDADTGEVKLPSGEKLTVKEIDVHLVLGIPHGGKTINTVPPLTATNLQKLRRMLMLGEGQELNLKQLNSIILRGGDSKLNYEEQVAFKIALLLYVDAYFLAPRGTTVKVNTELFCAISEIEEIPQLNWSGYVLKKLLHSAKRVQRSLNAGNATATLDGCLIFWVVFYLDNIDFGYNMTKQTVLPRMAEYSYDTIRKLCRIARKKNKVTGMVSFGDKKRIHNAQKVMYSRNTKATKLMPTTMEKDMESTNKSQQKNHEEKNLQKAVNTMMQWLQRVQNETEHARIKMMQALNENNTYQRAKLNGRENMRASTSTHGNLHDGHFIEVSSNSSTASENVQTDGKSCLDDGKGEETISKTTNAENNYSEDRNSEQNSCYTTDDDDDYFDATETTAAKDEGCRNCNWSQMYAYNSTQGALRQENYYGHITAGENRATVLLGNNMTGEDQEELWEFCTTPVQERRRGPTMVCPKNIVQSDSVSDTTAVSDIVVQSNKFDHKCCSGVIDWHEGSKGDEDFEEYCPTPISVRKHDNSEINMAAETEDQERGGATLICPKNKVQTDSVSDRVLQNNNFDPQGCSGVIDWNEGSKGDEHFEEFCPTPISVRKHDNNEIVKKDRRNSILIDNIEVDIIHMSNPSRFGLSPFIINMTHPDTELECVLKIQMAIPEVTTEQKQTMWYIHYIPTIVELRGSQIERMVVSSEDFDIDMMDALVRLYKQMDDDMYKRWSEKRWRHFLPTWFAVSALNQDINMASKTVEDLFVGSHISYNVAECRLVIATLMVDWHWCLYIWDFENNKVVVIDPEYMGKGAEWMEKRHKETVAIMHTGMKYCKEAFFPYPYNDMEGWATEYLEMTGATSIRNESGLYTMFYARYFDGDVLTRILTQGSTKGHRSNLVCQLLAMKGNLGQPPDCIRDATTPKST